MFASHRVSLPQREKWKLHGRGEMRCQRRAKMEQCFLSGALMDQLVVGGGQFPDRAGLYLSVSHVSSPWLSASPAG